MKKTDLEIIEATEKILIGMHLICDNYEKVISSDITSPERKIKLKNVALRSEKFINMFWGILDKQDMKTIREFHKKVDLVDETIENYYKSLENE